MRKTENSPDKPGIGPTIGHALDTSQTHARVSDQQIIRALLINNRSGDTALCQMTLVASRWLGLGGPFVRTDTVKGLGGETHLRLNHSAAELLLNTG